MKDKNFINIHGVYEIQTLSFTVDYANKKLVVLNSYGIAHPGYGDGFYYSIKVTGADGTVKANVSLKGNEESSKAAKALNNLAIEEGDVISITHDEAFYRLILKGAIKNQTPNQPATRTTNLEIGNDELIRK